MPGGNSHFCARRDELDIAIRKHRCQITLNKFFDDHREVMQNVEKKYSEAAEQIDVAIVRLKFFLTL